MPPSLPGPRFDDIFLWEVGRQRRDQLRFAVCISVYASILRIERNGIWTIYPFRYDHSPERMRRYYDRAGSE